MAMKAHPKDPWIGVNMLTEFIFCARAGLLEHEQQADDDGEENSNETVHVGFMPKWELHAIERALNERADQVKVQLAKLSAYLKGMAIASIPICLFGGIVAIIKSEVFWLVAGVALCLIGSVALAVSVLSAVVRLRGEIGELDALRHKALSSIPHEPNPMRTENQGANWWSLSKAGFESIVYKDPLRDESWRLAGRPWRVLRRGSLRIPVFKKRRTAWGEGRRLYRQHYARIAAYCRLIERCEGAESPYGIVLFDDGTYNGIAISKDAAGTWVPLRDGLPTARQVIRQSVEKNEDPSEPYSHRICLHCPWGKPFVIDGGDNKNVRYGEPLPVFGVTGSDSRSYHSACGDRFRWTPMHAHAIRNGLASLNS